MPTLNRHPSAGGLAKPFGGYIKLSNLSGSSSLRKHFTAASGEFVGTFLFLFSAYLGHATSVQNASSSKAISSSSGSTKSIDTIVFISLSYGFGLLVTAWILYRVSGGLFNPALTLGMVLTGTLQPVRGLVLFPVQILGGMCAAAVVSVIVPMDINTVKTTLAPGMNVAQGLFLEMFLTAELVFTVLMLAAEKSKVTFLAPLGIGLSLFVVEMAGVAYTGASVNPARSFGPCVAAAKFEGYHWIYWVGPILGAVVAGGFYHFVKAMNYEEANPGQDSAGRDEGKMQEDLEMKGRSEGSLRE